MHSKDWRYRKRGTQAVWAHQGDLAGVTRAGLYQPLPCMLLLQQPEPSCFIAPNKTFHRASARKSRTQQPHHRRHRDNDAAALLNHRRQEALYECKVTDDVDIERALHFRRLQ